MSIGISSGTDPDPPVLDLHMSRRPGCIDASDVDAYHRDGFLLIRGLFSKDEVGALVEEIDNGGRVAEHAFGKADATGESAGISLWYGIGDDIWSRATTSPRIVNAARILMGEEIAFYHGKVMLKLAQSGGSWEWHQDYGYWYAAEQFLFPQMMSVFVALDAATPENGCLNVLRGSHRLGRLDHSKVGEQAGVDPERIANLEPLFERVSCEMDPGDVLFFHCNTLHTSGPNESDHPRRSFIIAFNALSNPRLNPGPHRLDKPCPVTPDDDLLRDHGPTRIND